MMIIIMIFKGLEGVEERRETGEETDGRVEEGK